MLLNLGKHFTAWGKKEVFRDKGMAGWSLLLTDIGSVEESVRHVMDNCEELSDL